MQESPGYEGILVGAPPLRFARDLVEGAYFDEEFTLSLRLFQSMFSDPRQVLRVSFETSFQQDSAMHLDIGSYVGEDRYDITGDIVGKRNSPSEIEVPIRQECLMLNESYEGEEISRIELRALKNWIGVKSITVSID